MNQNGEARGPQIWEPGDNEELCLGRVAFEHFGHPAEKVMGSESGLQGGGPCW